MSNSEEPTGSAPEPPKSPPPAGWYDDPAGKSGHKRYWDGNKWTDYQSSPENPYSAPTGAAGGPVATAASGKKKPWYQRPLPLIGAGFAALVVIAAIAGGDDTSSTSTSSSSEGGSAASSSSGSSNSSSNNSSDSEAPPVASVGQPVDVEGTRYEVLSVRTASRVGDQYFGEDANGEFVIVKMELTNLKDETRTIISNAITLTAANGKTYEVSSDALLSVDNPILLEEIQPDLPEKGTVVFDVPKSQVSGSMLRVEDLFSDAYAEIDLDL